MKIDYSTYPILADIETGSVHMRPADVKDIDGYLLCMGHLAKVWEKASVMIRKNICTPCKTYIEAVEKSTPCFDRLIENKMGGFDRVDPSEWVDPQEAKPITEEERQRDLALNKLTGNAYGCYLLPNGQSVVYASYGNVDTPDRYMFCFEMVDNFVTRMYIQVGEDYSYFVSNNPTIARMLTAISNIPIVVVSHLQHEVNMLIMFERYAKIETRYIEPKTKARVEMKDIRPTLNDTRLKVHIRDSRYFTNIIRTKGFQVKGHLRLQPRKVNGEWTHELIYIDTFQKHGYHRQATLNNK